MTIKKSIRLVPSFLAGDETEIQEVLHPKDGELQASYSLAYARLAPGQSSLPHILKQSSEVYIIHTGKGTAHVAGQDVVLEVGDVLHIPAGTEQSITNTGATMLGFWCIVDPPWSKEEEIVG